ncbi:SAR2788 family putative toxin [Terribacillus saccharophilus]|uniref:SAR2788 family putative toxin n=1 Tax=Terribacillus saccharophilus TaxID=361277 RepID=UPI001140B504|nr:SAR2788 family putative toxin [Terribacillus saccharophilus]
MKYFIMIILAFFVFSSLVPHYASALSSQGSEKQPTPEEFSNQTENETTEFENTSVEIESNEEDDIAYIETTIESENLDVQSQLELDLDEGGMLLNVESEDENGEIRNQEYEVVIHDINGEDFEASLIDTTTGEEYEVNTAELQASWVPLVIIAIHAARFGVKYAIKKYGKSAVSNATKKYGKKASASSLKNLKFASNKLLDRHWKDHSKEFPGYTKSKYLSRAQSLAGTTGKHILTKKRSNGDILKYNKNTNELLVLTKNDTIKTLFKPKHPNKSAGYNYFKKQ